MRELAIMAEAKQRDDWSHTSNLLALLANVLGGAKTEPADFFPFDRKKRKQAKTMENPLGIDILKILLPKDQR